VDAQGAPTPTLQALIELLAERPGGRVDVDRESTPPSQAVGFGLVGVDSARESTPFAQSVVEWPVVADPTRGSARRPWPRLLHSG